MIYISSFAVVALVMFKAPSFQILSYLGSNPFFPSVGQWMLAEWSHWAVLVASHLIRSILEDSGGQALRSEIGALRVEVHRAKELVRDYNQVLDSCEKELLWRNRATSWFAFGNVVLGIVLVFLWSYHCYCRSDRSLIPALGDSALAEPEPRGVVTRSGPLRPSDLVRSTNRST